LPTPIGQSACKVVHRIRAAARSSPGPPGWFTMPVLHCETFSSWQGTGPFRTPNCTSTSDAASQIDEAASSSRPAESEPPPHLQAAFFSALMFSRDQFGSRFFWSRSSGTASFLVSLSNLTPLWATRHSIVAIFFVIAYREQPRAKRQKTDEVQQNQGRAADSECRRGNSRRRLGKT
jgi:hypothetical protein